MGNWSDFQIYLMNLVYKGDLYVFKENMDNKYTIKIVKNY